MSVIFAFHCTFHNVKKRYFTTVAVCSNTEITKVINNFSTLVVTRKSTAL